MQPTTIIRPQPGPQEKALSSPADVVILGGAKGGGKSFALRLAPVRYLQAAGFHAVLFRRTYKQHTNPGGQWDKSFELYPLLGGIPRKTLLKWLFPAGSTITFAHMEKETDWRNWQGTETTMFLFDQLEEFSQSQFLKILSCLRTLTNIPTQLWATCNPEADSWLAKFVEPWLSEDGYTDPEQDGQVKYFTVVDDQIAWVDAGWRDANGRPPKSVSYHTATVYDNPILLGLDPNYLSNLQAQSLVDRERYLGIPGRGGNWKIREQAGNVFRQEWAEILQTPPAFAKGVWCFDMGGMGDPTSGLHGYAVNGILYITQEVNQNITPQQQKQLLKNIASQGLPVYAWQDPGQSGLFQISEFVDLLGSQFQSVVSNLPKMVRANPVSAAFEQGRIKFVGTLQQWQPLLTELSGFPDAKHDDRVDALCLLYHVLMGRGKGRGSGKTKF